MGAKSIPTSTRPQIRCVALLMTPWVWAIATAMMMFHGKTFPRAAAVATVPALGGLAAWAIYHTLSRRNDGLASFIMALVFTTSPSDHRVALPLERELARAVFMLIPLALINAVAGLLLRESWKGDGRANGSPPRDAQVDPPSSG